MVDVASHPIVNPRTFEQITLRSAPRVQTVSGVSLSIASPNDLALLKLVAHRDQDIVDLQLLVPQLSAAMIAANAEQDDVERTVAEGAQTARLLAQSGQLADVAQELLGRPVSETELGALDQFLNELLKEGL
jgi:hypothetical protein